MESPTKVRVETLHVSSAARIIIVGDVHGCLVELTNLLNKIHFVPNPTRPRKDEMMNFESGDVLVMVGDLINKGPASFEVVRYLREVGAVGVVGNHDAKMLWLMEKIRRGEPLSDKDKASSLMELAQSCPADVEAYLRELPHIISIPQHRVTVVHAGMDPSLPVEEQHAEAVTRMRQLMKRKTYNKKKQHGAEMPEPLSISSTYVCLEKRDYGKSWSAVWSRAVDDGSKTMDESSKKHAHKKEEEEEESDEDGVRGAGTTTCHPTWRGTTVVYGHDAKRRLNQHKFAVGLDSGCIYGGGLSALLLPSWEVLTLPESPHTPKI